VATRVRDADALRIGLATVDHAGTTLGAVALAVALAELTETPARVLHFGVLPGASGVLPDGTFSAGPVPGPSPSAKPSPSATRSPRATASPSPRGSGSNR